jgi:hypothetical protein
MHPNTTNVVSTQLEALEALEALRSAFLFHHVTRIALSMMPRIGKHPHLFVTWEAIYPDGWGDGERQLRGE